MPKRLLDCCASDFRGFSKADLLESIQKSEGRVIACETIGTVQPLLGNVTNAEFAASMGADILLLNMFHSALFISHTRRHTAFPLSVVQVIMPS